MPPVVPAAAGRTATAAMIAIAMTATMLRDRMNRAIITSLHGTIAKSDARKSVGETEVLFLRSSEKPCPEARNDRASENAVNQMKRDEASHVLVPCDIF